MNNSAHVVGMCWSNDIDGHPTNWLWRDGSFEELWTWGEVFAINEHDVVVGYREALDVFPGVAVFQAVMWRDGQVDDLEVPPLLPDAEPLAGSWAYDVNDDERIIGGIVGSEDGRLGGGVVWGGTMLLGPLCSGSGCTPRAINNSNQIVGTWHYGDLHAALWEGESWTIIHERGEAIDINDNGVVVGYTSRPSDPDGWVEELFTWQDGKMTYLPTWSSLGVRPRALNIDGVVIGEHGSCSRGLLWRDNAIINVEHRIANGTGWHHFYAADINDSGWLVGYAWLASTSPGGTHKTERRAVMLLPVRRTDLDVDGDTDLLDFAIMQNAFTGPGE
jgi:uncharacterized membrane protein